MELYTFLQLFTGISFFLFGIDVLSSHLEKMAGGSLEKSLRKVTKNPLLGFILGAVITIAIESSTTLTVMVVGLVNSGIIPFYETLTIIMGANVGTTMTAWIISLMGAGSDEFTILSLLSYKTLTPVFAFVGTILTMASKKEKNKDIGTIMIGFSIICTGMSFMSGSMSGLTDMPWFSNFMVMFTNPFLALIVSTLLTVVIQS